MEEAMKQTLCGIAARQQQVPRRSLRAVRGCERSE